MFGVSSVISSQLPVRKQNVRPFVLIAANWMAKSEWELKIFSWMAPSIVGLCFADSFWESSTFDF